MNEVNALVDRHIRVIDLAADFRFSDLNLWESAYGGPHGAPQLIDEAVYGLPRSIEQRSPELGWLEIPVAIRRLQHSR